MTNKLWIVVVCLALACGAPLVAQDKPAAQAPAAGGADVPLKVQIVLSRYQGEKKTSSLPYTLSVTASTSRVSRASLRTGAQVPIVVGTTQGDGGRPTPTVQYRDVGTSIDCTASKVDDAHFKLDITIEDSSVYGDDVAGQGDLKRAGDRPAFRSFRSSNTVILRDAGSAQYSSAVDKVSGEVVKVDVTLTVLK